MENMDILLCSRNKLRVVAHCFFFEAHFAKNENTKAMDMANLNYKVVQDVLGSQNYIFLKYEFEYASLLNSQNQTEKASDIITENIKQWHIWDESQRQRRLSQQQQQHDEKNDHQSSPSLSSSSNANADAVATFMVPGDMTLVAMHLLGCVSHNRTNYWKALVSRAPRYGKL